MKSHSFISDDAIQSSDKKLQFIAECFDPKYDKDYKDEIEVQRRLEKDIERKAVFYIETPDRGLVDLVAQCKVGKDDEYKVTYQDMHKALTNDYNLSEQQTEYILAANYQGGIAGGIAGFYKLKAKTYDDCYYKDGTDVMMNEWLRDGVASKIIIDKDNNLSCVGGQKIMFDCSKQVFSSNADLKNMMGIKFNSQDFVAINITATLGKLGDTAPIEQVVIDVAGTGVVANQFIGKLETIKASCPAKDPSSIIKSNVALSKELVADALTDEQYKTVVTEKISKILHSEQDETEAITALKRLDGVKEALADLLVKQIDQAIEAQKDKKTDKLSAESINDIAKETAGQLSKFIDQPDKYTIKKFSEDLVKDRATSSDVIVPRKNFVEKICQYLKDKWHGYSYDKSKIVTLEQLHDKAKIVGQAAKSHMSSKISISPPPHNKKEGARTI
ncbi:hypothetical protein [Rickettsia endosymbiont of Oedothorax gibbosus]|uniref:hypothetical protein n=1 Tax=Rickettsia endosymbiont of Oedothorax gibbosus TaxID=931099 RepID=UPI002023CEE9|nr:hypothetical protein [Rickettsia endosymbiont of Oedothorax gibbosus]